MQRTFEIEELLSESGWLRMLAASLVADPAQADDLVQDTWLAALRHPPRTDSAPRPWLARVAHNLARNSRRGSARREARETFAAEDDTEGDSEGFVRRSAASYAQLVRRAGLTHLGLHCYVGRGVGRAIAGLERGWISPPRGANGGGTRGWK